MAFGLETGPENVVSIKVVGVGGGVSRVSEKFLPYIDIKTPIVAAKLHNEAGIIGAAYYASTKQK